MRSFQYRPRPRQNLNDAKIPRNALLLLTYWMTESSLLCYQGNLLLGAASYSLKLLSSAWLSLPPVQLSLPSLIYIQPLVALLSTVQVMACFLSTGVLHLAADDKHNDPEPRKHITSVSLRWPYSGSSHQHSLPFALCLGYLSSLFHIQSLLESWKAAENIVGQNTLLKNSAFFISFYINNVDIQGCFYSVKLFP